MLENPVFLAQGNYSRVKIYRGNSIIATSGISGSVYQGSFRNAHGNCKVCESFCIFLKQKLQPNLCDTDDEKLDIRICLNQTTMILSVNVFCDIIEKLSSHFGLHERTWIKIEFVNTRYDRPDEYRRSLSNLASQKILTEKGKFIYDGQMNCPKEWVDFFLSSSSEDSLLVDFSIMFGVDNLIHAEVPLKLPENSNLVALTTSILEKQIAADLVLICENGTRFPCHRSFLSAHSTTFESMLKDKNFVEGETGEINLDDMSEDGMNAFLKFLYCRDTKEPSENPSIAIELLTCGNKYGIDILVHSMREILLSKPTDWFDLSTALRLFYYGCQVESQSPFKQKALQILRLKSLLEIENSSDYRQLFSENSEAAKELCTALLSHLTLNK